MIKIKMCKHRLEHIQDIIKKNCNNNELLQFFDNILRLSIFNSKTYLIIAEEEYRELRSFLTEVYGASTFNSLEEENALNAIDYISNINYYFLPR